MNTAKHIEHPVPIAKHVAHGKRKKVRRYSFVLTPLNVTIFVMLALVVGMLIGGAIYRATTGALADFVCDSFVHLAVC